MTGYGVTVTTKRDADELWTADDVAAHCGMTARTFRSYVSRGQAPAPDRTYGRTPLWRPDTIEAWHASRPGRGWRAGAKG